MLTKAYDIGKAMAEGPVRQMTMDETKLLLGLTMMEMAKAAVPEALKEQFSYKVIDSRLAFHGIEVTDQAKALVTCLCSKVGDIILYAAAMKYTLSQHGEVTIATLVKTFPMGFPTDESLGSIWEQQKARDLQPDNHLDHAEAWA